MALTLSNSGRVCQQKKLVNGLEETVYLESLVMSLKVCSFSTLTIFTTMGIKSHNCPANCAGGHAQVDKHGAKLYSYS